MEMFIISCFVQFLSKMSELEDWISGINKAIENGADSISSIGRKI